MGRLIVLSVLALACLCRCGQVRTEENRISVSILPLKYWVDELSGGDFEVSTIVPPGSSPETYEPTPAQMKSVARSKGYIQIGLIDFEHALNEGIQSSTPHLPRLTLSEDIPLLEGTCGHDHAHAHHHGTDPHIWLSPTRMKTQVSRMADFLCAIQPDSASKYRANLARSLSRIDSLDISIRESFSELRSRTILIFHPFLSYYCADYGLEQLAVEEEGKEPSVDHLKGLISAIKEHEISVVFYQEQLHFNTVQALVRETGIRAVSLDPLAYDWMENMSKITKEIADSERNE